MRRKSVFDRYTYDQLKKFQKEYAWELEAGEDKGRAAAGAGLRSLFTNAQWNSASGAAFFDDALAIATRIDLGFFLK